MARDGFNREIDYLRISVTDRCNLGCLYCTPGRRPECLWEDELLTASEIGRIAESAMRYGVRKVRLTGGEPLMRADIVELVSAVKARGVRDLSLTTNGMLLSAMARKLKRAGLDRVNVSLDTLDPNVYAEMTGGGKLERVLEGISAAEGAGLSPVKLNMVPIRGMNDREIPGFARLTYERPCHIRFIEYMPTGRRKDWDESRCVKTPEVMDKVATLGPLVKLEFKGKGPSRNYRLEGARGVLGFISPLSHSFCYSCNRLRINAAGKIRPCLFSRSEVDLLAPLRRGMDDRGLDSLFARAIDMKPEGNYFEKPSDASVESMSGIGG